MNKNVAIVGLAVVVLVSGGLLLNVCCTASPPPGDPPPTPTPTPGSDTPGEYLTIEFNMKTSEVTGNPAVFAYPKDLDGVRECALVIFSNQTENAIRIVFLPSTSPTNSPFAGINKITLEAHREGMQFSKGFPVGVELSEEVPNLDYDYIVAEVGPPQEEQSPRIRIGPRQVTPN